MSVDPIEHERVFMSVGRPFWRAVIKCSCGERLEGFDGYTRAAAVSMAQRLFEAHLEEHAAATETS